MPPTPSTPPLVVAKFGGTSVSSRERWVVIAEIVRQHRAAGRRVLLVCSAVGGTSDLLEEAIADAAAGGPELGPAPEAIRALHHSLAEALEVDAETTVGPLLDELERHLEGVRLLREASPRSRAAVLSLGELMSTRLGAAFLQQQGLEAAWLDARDLLESDLPAGESPGRRYLSATCDFSPDKTAQSRVRGAGPVGITQGFIARDGHEGHTVLLGRGGSDTSAAYLAARLRADALEIWTDVHGLFTADPRKVPAARHLSELSYRQAESLSALGARVLHPRSIQPPRLAEIPVWVRSTLHPERPGTRIGPDPRTDGVQAVLHRGEIALVTAHRPPEWQSVGFIAEVSACFQRSGLPIDLFAASPAALQATLDLSAVPHADAALAHLEACLAEVCAPTVERDLGSLSLVGSNIHEQLERIGLAYGQLAGVSPRLVVHSADNSHVTLVLDPADIPPLARRLHRMLLEDDPPSATWSPAALLAAAPARAEAR